MMFIFNHTIKFYFTTIMTILFVGFVGIFDTMKVHFTWVQAIVNKENINHSNL